MSQADNLAALGSNVNSSGVLQPASGGTGTTAGVTGFKNRIINGAMVIDQRNNGASVSTASSNTIYTLDRFQVYYAQTSKFNIQQNAGSVTPPAGFTNYLGITSSSAYSSLSSDYFFLRQSIEGFNTADLNWGTANAKTVTLSFWVRSSLTGTFSGVLRNSAENLTYAFTYSIPVANTWTTISITIAGDTSGTWLTTNGIGIQVMWNIGSGSSGLTGTTGSWIAGGFFGATGSVSVVGTNGATFYITGVQLESGSTATTFDYRPYGTELALCQRYYQSLSFGTGNTSYGPYGLCRNALTLCVATQLPVQMRTAPSLSFVNSSANVLKQDGGTFAVTALTASGSAVNQISFEVSIGTSSLSTTGCAGFYGGSFVVNGASEL
jgi:hypothetical protein